MPETSNPSILVFHFSHLKIQFNTIYITKKFCHPFGAKEGSNFSVPGVHTPGYDTFTPSGYIDTITAFQAGGVFFTFTAKP